MREWSGGLFKAMKTMTAWGSVGRRLFAFVCLAASFRCFLSPLPASAGPSVSSPKATDDLFTNRAVPRLRIEIPPEGMAILRSYEWEWGGNSWARTNVLATVREGAL